MQIRLEQDVRNALVERLGGTTTGIVALANKTLREALGAEPRGLEAKPGVTPPSSGAAESATYLLGRCPECHAMRAAAVRLPGVSDVQWAEVSLEFAQSGLSVAEVETAGSVTIEKCAERCSLDGGRPTGGAR